MDRLGHKVWKVPRVTLDQLENRDRKGVLVHPENVVTLGQWGHQDILGHRELAAKLEAREMLAQGDKKVLLDLQVLKVPQADRAQRAR